MLTEEEMYALEHLRAGIQYEYRLDEHRHTLAKAMLRLFPKGWNDQAHNNSVKKETILSDIRAGDKFKVLRSWEGLLHDVSFNDLMRKHIGKTLTASRTHKGIVVSEEDKEGYKWHWPLEVIQKVEYIAPEEMTLAQWEKMSPQERLEWNRPAFEALIEEVEILYAGSGSAGWTGGSFVCLDRPCRPKKKPADPPKELWFVTNERGEFVTEEATSEEEARNWIDGPGNKDSVLRVVKYIIAE